MCACMPLTQLDSGTGTLMMGGNPTESVEIPHDGRQRGQSSCRMESMLLLNPHRMAKSRGIENDHI